MTDQNDDQHEKDWHKEAIEKLRALNAKVRSYDTKGSEENQSKPSSDGNLQDVSLEQIRSRLNSINSYFRDKLSGEVVDPPETEDAAPLPPPVTPPPAQQVPAPPRKMDPPKASPVLPSLPYKEPIPDLVETIPTKKVSEPAQKMVGDIPSVFKPTQNVKGSMLGVGLDLGTSSIIASREQEDNRVSSKLERNIFLEVKNDEVTKGLLAKLNIKYAATHEKLYVLGDMALELSHIFGRESQRPMRIGILNPTEMESLPIIKLLVQKVLWQPRSEQEICCFSVPAKIMDSESNVIYHQGVFERILKDLGFRSAVIEEGFAVVLSELAAHEFTGIGVSCGAGLVNVCAAFKSMPVLSFSVGRGGDWIDKNAATALGLISSNVMAIKEQGMDLTKPMKREEEAIAIYYRSYIHYFLEGMAQMFSSSASAPRFTQPVDIVFAGGSSMVGNFIEVVKEELKTIDLGIPVGRVRRAEEPLLSVSRGCLFHAMNLEK